MQRRFPIIFGAKRISRIKICECPLLAVSSHSIYYALACTINTQQITKLDRRKKRAAKLAQPLDEIKGGIL
jgi:hypothetical protein